MAIYRIYPQRDTFISTETPDSNQGLDEILEIGTYSDISGTVRVNRALIGFSTAEIQEVVENRIPSGTQYQADLKLFLAEASELPTSITVQCHPLVEDWENGVGKFGDSPMDTSGVTWKSRNSNQDEWTTPTSGAFTTSSYHTIVGGGVWSTAPAYANLEYEVNLYGNSDIQINITPVIEGILESEIPNYGLILKLPRSIEFVEDRSIRLRYFGRDTNTVYSPYLDFKWDDSLYTGSLPVLSSSNFTIKTLNNKGIYHTTDSINFRLTCRPTFPVRVFSTGSLYLQNYAIPSGSTWAIVDEQTGEYIVDFDNDYTKISTDGTSSFFTVHMNMLYPTRYYRLRFKVNVGGTLVTVEDTSPFLIRE